jgi:hypothetical protein
MISFRYVPAMCVLLTLALIPTIIHSYSGGQATDGRSATAISDVIVSGYQSAPTNRNTTWGKRRFDSDDWIEREYRPIQGRGTVKLTVVRSFDAKRVYHHPELAVSDTTNFVADAVRRFKGRPDIPVHVLTPGPGVSTGGMYVLQYDDRFVDDPVWFQIRTAGELLFRRRQPMTLFFVLDSSGPPRGPEGELAAGLRVLFGAIDGFVQQAAHDLVD